MQHMMAIFKYIGIFFVLAILLAGGWFGWQMYHGLKMDESSREFVNRQLPKLAKERWYGPVMRPLAHDAFMEAVSMKQWHDLSNYYYNHLGDLTQFGECDGQAMINYHNGEKITLAKYACEASFDKGQALIEVTLRPASETNEAWKILSINVKSPAFMK
jgi:hypothetical protein